MSTFLIDDILRSMGVLMNDSAYQQNFPPMNVGVEEGTGEMTLEFALAGYTPEDVDVMFNGEELTIQAKQASGVRLTGTNEKFQQMKHGIRSRDFRCQYKLAPGKFDTSKARAIFKNGILSIELPVAENRAPRKLQITS